MGRGNNKKHIVSEKRSGTLEESFQEALIKTLNDNFKNICSKDKTMLEKHTFAVFNFNAFVKKYKEVLAKKEFLQEAVKNMHYFLEDIKKISSASDKKPGDRGFASTYWLEIFLLSNDFLIKQINELDSKKDPDVQDMLFLMMRNQIDNALELYKFYKNAFEAFPDKSYLETWYYYLRAFSCLKIYVDFFDNYNLNRLEDNNEKIKLTYNYAASLLMFARYLYPDRDDAFLDKRESSNSIRKAISLLPEIKAIEGEISKEDIDELSKKLYEHETLLQSNKNQYEKVDYPKGIFKYDVAPELVYEASPDLSFSVQQELIDQFDQTFQLAKENARKNLEKTPKEIKNILEVLAIEGSKLFEKISSDESIFAPLALMLIKDLERIQDSIELNIKEQENKINELELANKNAEALIKMDAKERKKKSKKKKSRNINKENISPIKVKCEIESEDEEDIGSYNLNSTISQASLPQSFASSVLMFSNSNQYSSFLAYDQALYMLHNGDLDNAKLYFNIALDYSRREKNISMIAKSYFALSDCYYSMASYACSFNNKTDEVVNLKEALAYAKCALEQHPLLILEEELEFRTILVEWIVFRQDLIEQMLAKIEAWFAACRDHRAAVKEKMGASWYKKGPIILSGSAQAYRYLKDELPFRINETKEELIKVKILLEKAKELDVSLFSSIKPKI